jgi:RecA-family ATPase
MEESLVIEDWELQAREELNPEPLIDGILWSDDRALLIAPQKTGKSIVTLQIARSLAGQTPFLGFEVPEVRTVLYLSGEGDMGELKSRSKEMGSLIPTEEGKLFYWPIPQHPLNRAEGLEELMKVGEQIKPDLTIFDPAYSLMTGSLKEDEAVGDFLRNLNLFQKETGSAMMITHHIHRPRMTENGQRISEGDQSYYGNMLWTAWPKRVYLLEMKGKEKMRTLSCSTYRDKTGLVEPMDLTLVEPSPLILQQKVEGWTGPMWQVFYKLEQGGIAKSVIVEMLTAGNRPRSTAYAAISSLEAIDVIHDSGNGIYVRT